MIQAVNLDTETIVASLRKIIPPAALIDIGIGRGIGIMHQWHRWDVPAAWLVDTESGQLAWTETLVATHPGWRIHVATVAETDGRAPCYRASNPAESGLIPISKLATLWPNLHEKECVDRPITRLDTLLASEDNLPAGAGWWLIVDCLPALRILQGATSTLERCSVLWLRTLLRPLSDNEVGTTIDELLEFLTPLGFRCVQITEGNHPALGDALFVRDWAHRLRPVIAKLQANKALLHQQYQHLETRLATQETAATVMLQEKNAQAEIAAARQAQLDNLGAERFELVAKVSAAEKAHQEFTSKLAAAEKECVIKSEALAAAQSQASTFASEYDAQIKLATDSQAKIELLFKEKSELVTKLEEKTKLAGERLARLEVQEQEKEEQIIKFDALSKMHAELADKLSTITKQQSTSADACKSAQAALTERTVERDAQTKSVIERQLKIDALVKEKSDFTGQLEEKTKLAEERQAKLEILAKEKVDVIRKFDVLNKTHIELVDKLAKISEKHEGTAGALKTANSALTKLTEERDTQTKLVTEQQSKLEILLKENTEFTVRLEDQTTLASERQALLEGIGKEKTALTEKLAAADKAKLEFSRQKDTLQEQLNQLAKARDEQANQQAQIINQQKELTKRTEERDAQAKLAVERQSRVDALVKEKTGFTAKLEELTKLAHERQALLESVGKEKTALTEKLAVADKDKLEFSRQKVILHEQLDQLKRAREEQATLATERANQLSKITSQRDELTKHTEERDIQIKLATDRQSKINALTKEKTEALVKLEEQTKLADERQALFEGISKEKITLAEKLATADRAKLEFSRQKEILQDQLDQLTKARDEQARLATERANQLSQMTSQRNELNKENQLVKSDAQAKEVAIARLNERIAEQDHREHHLVEEIVRAEAQIELIKDLLLREGGM